MDTQQCALRCVRLLYTFSILLLILLYHGNNEAKRVIKIIFHSLNKMLDFYMLIIFFSNKMLHDNMLPNEDIIILDRRMEESNI
jgi:hypothetical protein